MWLSGAFFAIRKVDFENIGLFDEDLFMYGEEYDIHLRIQKHFPNKSIQYLKKTKKAGNSAEVARLQAFPDWYYINGPYVKFHSDPLQDKYEQVGDAIPVLMAKALAVSMRAALNELK